MRSKIIYVYHEDTKLYEPVLVVEYKGYNIFFRTIGGCQLRKKVTKHFFLSKERLFIEFNEIFCPQGTIISKEINLTNEDFFKLCIVASIATKTT